MSAVERTEPGLEDPYVLRRRLSPRNEVNAAVRLSQAA